MISAEGQRHPEREEYTHKSCIELNGCLFRLMKPSNLTFAIYTENSAILSEKLPFSYVVLKQIPTPSPLSLSLCAPLPIIMHVPSMSLLHVVHDAPFVDLYFPTRKTQKEIKISPPLIFRWSMYDNGV